MFKSVEYVGFDQQPDRRELAEKALPYLADEIRTWRDSVVVTWRPGASALVPLQLTLALTLPNASDSVTGSILSDDLVDEGRLRSRFRKVWGGLLDRLIEQQMRHLEESLRQPAEV